MNINGRLLWLLLFDLFMINFGHLHLFRTENTERTQAYDCIYYANVTARNNETTPYCIREKDDVSVNRSLTKNTCGSSGQEWTFKVLKQMSISQDEVLAWNSSIEMVDRYAAYLVKGQEEFADEKICNCSNSTFGKFCEYKFMTMNTFEDTINYQFDLKEQYRNGSQLWGNITCYITLTDCYSGLRCLTWQNICDGKQQCMEGIDEDYCERLEFNECQENEYRCLDGSCISEEYWLDGEYDCSDKSDEQEINSDDLDGGWCPLVSSRFDCDEAVARFFTFACGDGEFVSDDLNTLDSCYNYRKMMFFCEYRSIADFEPKMWTLENGHCVEKGWIEKNLTETNDFEKCIVYLKCLLTDKKAIGCDEVVEDYYLLCDGKRINYPPGSFFKPYAQVIYRPETSRVFIDSPDFVIFQGRIKCVQYLISSLPCDMCGIGWLAFQNYYPFDDLFCTSSKNIILSDSMLDKKFINDTKQSFFCQQGYRLISKYRLGDNFYDCSDGEDEEYECGHQTEQRHRFHCYRVKSRCLLVSQVGDHHENCADASDEYSTQLKWALSHEKCTTSNKAVCDDLKLYIQSSSSLLLRENRVLLFRQYCDTIWHLPKGSDEILCNSWKCPRNEYQCLTGHCTPIDDVVHPTDGAWNCPDASDNIGFLKIKNLSEHNARLINNSEIEDIKKRISTIYDYVSSPFSVQFCNRSEEYGCILANVVEPLNFTENRPCIDFAQIGDGVIDCYGGLDERNLLTCGNNTLQQRGFDFHCSDQECILYQHHCEQRCSNNADNLLCDQLPTLRNSQCKKHTRFETCINYRGSYCYSYSMDALYYCDPIRSFSSTTGSLPYRFRGLHTREVSHYILGYPKRQSIVSFDVISLQQQQQREPSNINVQQFSKEEDDGKEGWICGRGVAIQNTKNDTIQCFCPPSLYGQYCQYYTDRITVITSFYNIPPQISEQSDDMLKVLALLLSDDDIIDYHVFHLPLIFSNELKKKFRFNLLYIRPKKLSKLYKVRFEAYHLSFSSSIKLIAVWEYAIRFPFLPSYRLAQILKFENEQVLLLNIHICKTSSPCRHNGICYPIMNKLNDTSAYYCHCNSHSFGKQCEHVLQTVTSSNCSKYASEYRLSLSKSLCLCPAHLYGPTCHINHTCIQQNPCGINRGRCYPNPDNIYRDYICICDKKYFGNNCEFNSSVVRFHFTDISFIQIPSNYIMSSIIQLCDFDNKTFDLIVRQKRVYQGFPPLITEIFHNNYYLPSIAIMKLYHKQDLLNNYIANLKQPEYFLLYIVSSNVSQMDVPSIVGRTNHCPYIKTVFTKNISNSSHLSQIPKTKLNNQTELLFQYHLLCDSPYSLICFHDDNYFCLCDMYGHAECSRYETTLDECSGRCRVNGQCIHGDLDDRKDFICLCPRCYYGSICQHNTQLFSFTLETLLTKDLYLSSVITQKIFSSLLIIIPIILFLIGGINNLCCYVTFNRKKPLLVGIGHYLRTVSVINQVALLTLLLKLMHIVLSSNGVIINQMMNTILCKILSYLVSCVIRMSYWLMGMVAIERVYVTWHLQGMWLKSLRTAKCIIMIIIIGIFVFDVHELIYYQSIEDPKSSNSLNITWCVTSYPSIVAKYNQVNTIFNFILPLLINFLSTIILLILITRKRATATRKRKDNSQAKSDWRQIFQSYIVLIRENKELVLAPLVTMLPQLLSIPQFILSFALACREFEVNWQRYLLMISYLITYLPQVFSYKLYVSPSSFYKKEFKETALAKKLVQWRALMNRDT